MHKWWRDLDKLVIYPHGPTALRNIWKRELIQGAWTWAISFRYASSRVHGIQEGKVQPMWVVGSDARTWRMGPNLKAYLGRWWRHLCLKEDVRTIVGDHKKKKKSANSVYVYNNVCTFVRRMRPTLEKQCSGVGFLFITRKSSVRVQSWNVLEVGY